jgi:hypothetical protein
MTNFNKIIADFMNLEFNKESNSWKSTKNDISIIDTLSLNDKDGILKFDNSYDWLLEVIKKISNLKSLDKDGYFFKTIIKNTEENTYVVTISQVGKYSFDKIVIIHEYSDNLIESIYKSVIKFINYYNIEIKNIDNQ